ncbi:MAG: thioredoxin-dependent thiol peroxidase [Pedobacter sp.]|nr:MAG: thioredoxin-dependent thiol peroxidase [Pedobacter sp.]
MLKVGDKAPAFQGIDQNGNTVSLDKFKGQKLILYFYPKDNTPGCTAEACDFRDQYQSLLAKGFAVVGVSADSEKSHAKFSNKFNLPFPLIADTEHQVLNAYEAYGEKKLYGKTYMGVIRKTFVINSEGVIEQIIEKVDTKAPSAQILALS